MIPVENEDTRAEATVLCDSPGTGTYADPGPVKDVASLGRATTTPAAGSRELRCLGSGPRALDTVVPHGVRCRTAFLDGPVDRVTALDEPFGHQSPAQTANVTARVPRLQAGHPDG